MIQQPRSALWMLPVFASIGALMMAVGFWLRRKFRDPNEGKQTFQHMAVTPRALLEGLGRLLIFAGPFFIIFGFVFAFAL